MEENAKPMKEMNVQEVKEFIEKEFESGVAEMFEGTAEFNTPAKTFFTLDWWCRNLQV